jgi:sulfur transfer complex TusBCD TusB component (DsrH family)
MTQPHITDEEEELLLIESRIHWAIKRNILRDTISEDLVWAQCIKNDDFFERLRYENVHINV